MATNDLINFNQVTERDHKEVKVRSGCKFAKVQSDNDHDHRYFQVTISGSVWPQSIEFRERSVLQCWYFRRQICPRIESFSQLFARTNSRTFWNLSTLYTSACCIICILFCARHIQQYSTHNFNTVTWNSIQYMYCYLQLKHTAVITCTLPVAFTTIFTYISHFIRTLRIIATSNVAENMVSNYVGWGIFEALSLPEC